jgi:alkane 1-monooxygenase
MTASVRLFALCSFSPVPLLALASWSGGVWAVAAFALIAGGAALLDRLIAHAMANSDQDTEFPATDALSVLLALAHFALLALAVAAIAGNTGLSGWERVLVFLAHGLFFGQVSNANAHELIHRANPWLRRLGTWVYISLLFGHHASAHPKVHHRYVASDQDPNSARRGESVYQFLPRAWAGSFAAGLRQESRDLQRARRHWLRHPYLIYLAGSVAFLLLALFTGTTLAWLALSAHATVQLLLSDYVQHYGLQRRRLDNGRLEPVSPAHSWNTPHWFTSHMMLNAPRHSDHHAHPARPYPQLQLPADAPLLPRSLPVMATLALFPRRWRKVMDKRVKRVRAITRKTPPAG